jgi:hypothetical protein
LGLLNGQLSGECVTISITCIQIPLYRFNLSIILAVVTFKLFSKLLGMP